MKRVIAIGRKTPTFDQLIVNPDYCPHLNVVTVAPGSPTGKPWDEAEPFAQCLDCGAVLDDNRQWVMPELAEPNDEIPF